MGRRSKDDPIDWAAIERHYRANRLSLNEIAKQYGVSRPAISNRAEKEGWVRDLSEKIDQETKNKVAMGVAISQLPGNLPPEKRLADRVVVEVNSQLGATVELENRADVAKALSTQRALLDELATLTDPKFADALETIAEAMDESGPTPSGGWKTDKVNELYRYVISLAGRIKMAKELAAAHGVYIPLQRKLFGLDSEKQAKPYEELLERLGSQAQ